MTTTTSTTTTGSSTSTPISTSGTSMGCYQDQSAWSLDGASTTNSKMTPAFCQSYCGTAGSYTYYGVENAMRWRRVPGLRWAELANIRLQGRFCLHYPDEQHVDERRLLSRPIDTVIKWCFHDKLVYDTYRVRDILFGQGIQRRRAGELAGVLLW